MCKVGNDYEQATTVGHQTQKSGHARSFASSDFDAVKAVAYLLIYWQSARAYYRFAGFT